MVANFHSSALQGEEGLKEAEAARMQEIEELKQEREQLRGSLKGVGKELEELKRERGQLDVSLKAARKEMADQTEAAGRDEAELLRQISDLEAQVCACVRACVCARASGCRGLGAYLEV